MSEGFVIEGCFDEEYYCSTDCLYKVYNPDQYADMFADDNACWTDWHDEMDIYEQIVRRQME